MNAHSSGSSPSRSDSAGGNRLRIIGGRWRGTRLQFPAVAAIRPTPDRVRETLFNWLQQQVPGARCLDLYAGSGALGLEALSRGARSAVFVDQEPGISHYLRETLMRLHCPDATVHLGTAQHYLQHTTQSFDLIFLDPPFAMAQNQAGLAQLFQQLKASPCLNDSAWIYLECPAALAAPDTWSYWPRHWQLQRSKQAGQVGYHLARAPLAENS